MAREVLREGPHGDCLLEIDGKVRIESGLPLKTAIATPELLHNAVTHPDYVMGSIKALTMGGDPLMNPDGSHKMVPAVDARGQEIKHGR